MLGALRKCPAHLSRTITATPSACRPLRLSVSTPSVSASRLSSLQSVAASRAFHQSVRWRQQAAARYADPVTEADVERQAAAQPPPSDGKIDRAVAQGPITKFQDLARRGLVHESIIQTITRDMKLETMTEVQTATINEALKGTDIIAQAKTGTGKTIGFLLPVLQHILEEDPSLARKRYGARSSPDDIRALIISPTRELAEQIAVEARRLTANTNIIVQTAVGGTQKSMALRQMQRQGCHVLVGTPGRLNDVFSDEYTGVKAPKLSALVLDEADRLLDAGFWPEIESIQQLLPDPRQKDRQTLMFSATVPREVIQLVRRTLKPGFKFVKTVRDDEEPTHTRVPQKVVNAGGFENVIPTLLELCQREIEAVQSASKDGRPFKAIVYFNSTAEVTLASSIFHNLGNRRSHPLYPARIYEIHSKLTQAQRTKASDSFRNSTSAILFSSDVTARGMDFPNVTHVIQVGLPKDRDTYIHRIGRTARAGKEGEGWLIIPSLEQRELAYRLDHLPIQPDASLEAPKVDMARESSVPAKLAGMLGSIREAIRLVDPTELAKSYKASLGVYQWYPSKQRLLDALNRLAKYGWGMETPPSIPHLLAQRLGMAHLDGVNVSRGRSSDDDSAGRPSLDGRTARFGDRAGAGDRFGGRSRASGGFGGHGRRDEQRGGVSQGRRDDRSGGFSQGRRDGERGGFSRGRGDRSGGSFEGRGRRTERAGGLNKFL